MAAGLRVCDTTSISTTAIRQGDKYVVNGQKVWISRAEHSDLMAPLARAMPQNEAVGAPGGDVEVPAAPIQGPTAPVERPKAADIGEDSARIRAEFDS